MVLRQEKKQDRENHVNRQELHAFQPVRFPVAADFRRDEHRRDHGHHFRDRELQVHRVPDNKRKEHQHRRHKQSDLQTRSHRDVQAQVHLVLHRHPDRRGMFSRIADDCHNDHDFYERKALFLIRIYLHSRPFSLYNMRCEPRRR
jgi:hypothetical protein